MDLAAHVEQTGTYEGDPWEEVIGRSADARPNVSISEVLDRFAVA